MSNLAIEALEKQIQIIAFDANLWDRGIADYPYAEKCSIKRKKLQAEIEKLKGEVVETVKHTRRRPKSQNTPVFWQTQGQLELFPETDTSRK